MDSVIARATALTLCLSASAVGAQSAPATTPDAVASNAAGYLPLTSSPGYLPLTSDERWSAYLHSIVGPLAFVEPAIGAGLGTLGGLPKFWQKTPGGFGERFGTSLAAHAADESIKASLSAALHEDNTYYRCSCRNVFGRIGHALFRSVIATNDNGRPVPAFGEIAGAYAGGFTTWGFYQHDYDINGALRLGTDALGMHALTNVAREFIRLPF
jgi:hypothetical protein